DLAAPLPERGRSRRVDRRADEHERQHDQKRNAGRDEVDQVRHAQTVAPLPEPVQLDGEQAEAIQSDREQVTEKERGDEGGRRRKAQRQRAFAQRHPSGERPEGEADAEYVIQDADLEDAVIEKQDGNERQRRPASEQHAMEYERARNDQEEGKDRERLPG